MFKVNKKNSRKICEICLKLTKRTPEWRHWRRSGVFIVNVEHISHLFQVFLLLSLSMLFICWGYALTNFIRPPGKDLWQFRGGHLRCSIKKIILKNFTRFTGKQMCWSLLFNKVSGQRLKTLLKKRLQHRCFLANFAKFLRTLFLQNTPGQLLLTFLFYRVSVNGYLYKKFSRNLVKMLDWPCLKIAYLNVKNICNSKVQNFDKVNFPNSKSSSQVGWILVRIT